MLPSTILLDIICCHRGQISVLLLTTLSATESSGILSQLWNVLIILFNFDLYFSLKRSVSSSASVLVHGQIANSREKKTITHKQAFHFLVDNFTEKSLVFMLANALTAEILSQMGC